MQPRLGFIVFQSIRQLSSNVDSEPASLPRSKKNPITHSEHSPHNQITLVRKTFDLAPDFSRKHIFESLWATRQHPADRFSCDSQPSAGASQEDLSLSTHVHLTHPTGHLQPPWAISMHRLLTIKKIYGERKILVLNSEYTLLKRNLKMVLPHLSVSLMPQDRDGRQLNLRHSKSG